MKPEPPRTRKEEYAAASILSAFERRPVTYSAVLLFCWVILLYWQAFTAPFVYDDLSIIQKNSTITSLRSALTYFRAAVPYSTDFPGPAGFYYRPLIWLSFALDRGLWGLFAPGYHLTNILLHWLNGWLGFLLLRRLSVPLLPALGTCLIWLALPVNSEVVAWTSARSHCLVFSFVLLALLSCCWYVQTRRAAALAGYFICALSALLTHELGLVLLPFSAIVLTVLNGWRTRTFVPVLSLALAANVLYAVMRHQAGGTSPATFRSVWPVGLSYLKYLGWLLLPLRMSIERSTDTPPPTFSFASILALVLLSGAIAAAIVLRKKAPDTVSGLAWALLALLPVSGLAFLYQGMAERYDYMASGGLVFAAVSLHAHAARHRPLQNAIAVCLVAWTLCGAVRLYSRLGDWSTETKLYQSSLEATPRSWILLLNLGNAYLQRGDLAHAVSTYEQALRVKPDASKAIANLGAALEMGGDFAGAEQQFRRALALDPNQPDIYSDLGTVVYEQGRMNEAATLFRKAISLNPRDATSYFNLGVLYAHAGHAEIAARMYEQALQINPEYPDAVRALRLLRNNSQ
jgi:protein O-mannosyl-transferase